MMEVTLVLTTCFLLAFFANPGQCCGPAEIGQQYNITSTADVLPADRVSWQLKFKFITTILFESSNATSNPTSINPFPNLYVGSRTKLTILNVNTTDGSAVFEHIVRLATVYTCTLPVYKRASRPTCETVQLTGNQISKECTTVDVYPQAKCQFTLQNGGRDRRVITDNITYIRADSQLGENGYYSTTCKLQYPVDGLKPGTWTVQVNMYPDLPGVSLAQGTVGDGANTLPLSYPTVTIDNNTCPQDLGEDKTNNVRQGYIKQGGLASCLCTLAHTGAPAGEVKWSSTQDGSFEILEQKKDAVTIKIKSHDTFTCQGTTVLDGSPQTTTYTPKYAYGPNSAELTFQRPGPIYLCPNQKTNIGITCQVSENSFKPAILFTIRDSNNNNLVTKVGGDTEQSKSVNYNFTKSGQHNFTCRVENAIFSDIFREAPANSIQVYAAPSDAPKISYRSSQHGDILVEGDDVTVTCVVEGGYPPVQSVTLTCGQDQSVTRNETSATLTLNEVDMNYNETNCTCQATHVTGCYQLTSNHTLIVMMENQTRIQLEDSPPIGAAVGGAIGAFIIIAVVVGGFYFIRRRMKQKKHHRADDEAYDPKEDPTAVFTDNIVYGTAIQEPSSTSAKDYTAIKPTMESATTRPKNCNPEKEENPYENVKGDKLDRKSLVKTTETKPAPAAKPKIPKTSVKTKAMPKSSEKAQDNPSGETEYTTVEKTKTEHSQSSDHDQRADITSAGASGEIPEIPDRHYNPEEIKDSVNEPSTSKPSKGNKKNIKEKITKKEKEKKDKKEKKKKGKNKDEDHVYSNKGFDQSGDGEVYANIGTSMKSSTNVDDGIHKNKDGLVYTTIVGVGSLKGVQRPVHHPRTEAPVD